MTRLTDYFYELAAKALTEVDPVPLAPTPPPCASGGAQEQQQGPAGSPEVARIRSHATDARVLTQVK